MKRIIMATILVLLFSGMAIGVPGTVQWRLSWNPNTETDLSGYKVYYGIASGIYTKVVDVGKVTSYVATGNIPQNSFVALTAYDLSGNESAYSAESFFDKDTTAPAVVGNPRFEKIP